MPTAARFRLTLAALLLGIPAVAVASPAGSPDLGPKDGDFLFEIRRNGTPVGTHRVALRPEADGVRAESQSTIAVRFLGVTVYRFSYQSVSLWSHGRMVALDSATDDDGTVTRVMARVAGERLRVTATGGKAEAALGLLPTDHWNPKAIGATEVLNTITGKVNRVTMTAEGREEVPTGDRRRPSTRYRYTGELQATVWYDDAGHWTALRFAARDGSNIDYVCQRCGPDPELAERAP